MEDENLNQPAVNPVENPVQLKVQTESNLLVNRKGIFPLTSGILALLLIVGGGAYYLGTQKGKLTSQVADTNQTQPSQATVYTSPSPTSVAWKTESVQIQKETAVSGIENISLTFQLPSEWMLETVLKASSPNNLIKNCADYVLTAGDGTSTLTISPVCAGWVAEYTDWPQATETITEEQNVGADNHTSYTVRYLDATYNKYRYVEGEKGTSNKIMDIVTLTYDKSTGNFLPLEITLDYTGSDKDTILNITDKIVSTLTASK